MISQDVHVLCACGALLWRDVTLMVIDAVHAKGVSERSELTACNHYAATGDMVKSLILYSCQ